MTSEHLILTRAVCWIGLCVASAATGHAQDEPPKSQPAPTPSANAGASSTFAERTATVARAYARISVLRASHDTPSESTPGERRRIDLISGFLFDAEGLVLTVGEPLDQAMLVTVDFPDQSPMLARVVGFDPQSGVGVLRIDPVDARVPRFGTAHAADIGAQVYAYGNPYDIGQTLAVGHVTGADRVIRPGEFEWRGLLQVSFPVHSGDQGGPVFTDDGTVIAMLLTGFTLPATSDEPSHSVEGVSFALPADTAIATARTIIEFSEKQGETSAPHELRPWFGVRAYDIQDPILRRHLKLEDGVGILMEQAFRNSPAERAGLRAHDILLTIDGKKVLGSAGFGEIIRGLAVDQRIRLGIIRDGDSLELELVVGGR